VIIALGKKRTLFLYFFCAKIKTSLILSASTGIPLPSSYLHGILSGKRRGTRGMGN